MATVFLTPPEQHGDADRVVLDESEYAFEWSWNARSGRWWLSISDDTGQIAYIPIVAGFPLLRSVTGTRRPPGELMVFDALELGREPGLRDFSTDFRLVYTEEADLPEGY